MHSSFTVVLQKRKKNLKSYVYDELKKQKKKGKCLKKKGPI